MPANVNPDPWLPPAPCPPLRGACAARVYRVHRSGSPAAVTGMDELPNVECLAVQEREGPDPGSAVFRYRFDGQDPTAPQDMVGALSTLSTLPRVVEVGDELAVSLTRPDGVTEWLFDGFPQSWSAALGAGVESVVMHATGVGKRCWDDPLLGMVLRDGSAPETVSDVETGIVPRFNPRGVPNACPKSAESGSDPNKYPVFLDPNIKGTDSGGVPYPRAWDLAMAVAYVQDDASDWVTVPTRSDLDALLVSREPIAGTPFDPTDSATYTAKPIAAGDAPFLGKAWPVVVHDQVADYGFGMCFALSTDGGSHPTTAVKIWLKQAGTVKSLYLQERLDDLDPSASNVGEGELARDLAGVVNRYVVDGALNQYEASLVLAPGFPSQQSDSAGAPEAFNTTASGFATSAAFDAYRTWLFDESGEGHYHNNGVGAPGPPAEISGVATSLDDVLGAPAGTPPAPQYAARRRPPIGTLFKQDANGKPLKHRLAISTDYAGSYPACWDGTGTWQPVEGGYELLRDRLGVRVTVHNPNSWHVGKSGVSGAPFPDGKVNAVERIGAPTSDRPAFFLRLTCVLEGDQALEAVADRQATSPLSQTVERRIDASDRHVVQVRAKHSEFNNTGSALTNAVDSTLRDDTAHALAEATAARTANEAGVFDGEVTIPYLTRYYAIGDRIDGIVGRNLGLRTDAGGTGYAAVLPVVVARRWDLIEQRTHLTLSDAGLDRRRYSLRRGKPGDAARRAARYVRAASGPGPIGGFNPPAPAADGGLLA